MKHLGRLVAVLTVFMLGVVACGTGAPAGESEVQTAEEADTGASIEVQDWLVTLIDSPELREQVGEMGWQDTVLGEGEWIPQGAGEAEGVWLICTVDLTNNGEEMRMLSGKILKVTDDQGREFSMTGQSAHFIQIWSTEGWAVPDNQTLQNPIEAGVSLVGPVIFDIAEDATGLRLTGEGIEESIGLGF